MFVKVSVSYGAGSRSYPLDLLLYDSQCWHCAYTGECNAKAGGILFKQNSMQLKYDSTY